MADDDEQPQVGRLAREVADWEYVSQGLRSYTQRKVVPGGWIYRTVVENHPAMCFVPEPHITDPTGPQLRVVEEDRPQQ